MRICFITDLPVWSLGKGKGAPSFYNTLELYNDRGDQVTLITTEQDLDLSELANIKVVKLRKYRLLHSRMLGGSLRLFHKYYLYVKYQLDGLRELKRTASDADVVYAYEIGFVPATKMFCQSSGKKWVSRFQGTILTDLIQTSGRWRKIRLYLQFYDHILALKMQSSLTIMTDDGTKGDQVLRTLRGVSRAGKIEFYKNGVDSPDLGSIDIADFGQVHQAQEIVFSSVSRVQRWKRLDRSVEVFEAFQQRYPQSHYYIVGEGPALAAVKELVIVKGLQAKISFLGSLDKSQIYGLLLESKYFLSSYELSNLGNPLFEAICCGAIVATLDNGATCEMIHDQVTGLLSPEERYMDNADKLIALESDQALQKAILLEAKTQFSRVMDSWSQRMDKEYNAVAILNDE